MIGLVKIRKAAKKASVAGPLKNTFFAASLRKKEISQDKRQFVERNTVCPGSSDPFYIGRYYMKWVTTS